MSDATERAWEEGSFAKSNGKTLEDNPYYPVSQRDMHESWKEGFTS